MNNSNSYTVQGWMKNNLKLKGKELSFFAIVWGFSQDQRSRFRGSIDYITSWLSCSRPTAINVKRSLIKKGLILEFENNDGNEFCVTTLAIQGSKETLPPLVKKLYPTSKKTLPLASKETLPNNNNYNNNNNYKRKLLKSLTFKEFLKTPNEFKDFFSEKEKERIRIGMSFRDLFIGFYGELNDDRLKAIDKFKVNDALDTFRKLEEISGLNIADFRLVYKFLKKDFEENEDAKFCWGHNIKSFSKLYEQCNYNGKKNGQLMELARKNKDRNQKHNQKLRSLRNRE